MNWENFLNIRSKNKEKTENQCKKTACEQKTISEKRKFVSNKKLGLKWTMNGLRKPFRKNLIQKVEKQQKSQWNCRMWKKPQARKRIFVQTPFSHSTLKLERKNSRRKTTLFFAPFPVSAWPKSLLQFDFINYENVWTDLKRQRPNTIPILWIVKNRSAILACWEDEGGYE